MPTYEYECHKGHKTDEFRSVDDRHNTPLCQECSSATTLVISAVRGFVTFPAGGGQEYISPASGRYITSKRARLDDLARTNCREYEGFASESKEAAKRVKEQEKKSDAKLDDSVRRAWHALPPSKKKVLAG